MAEQENRSNAPEPAAKGKRLALVMGVNGASGYRKSPLQYAVNDATTMAEVLQQSCGFEVLGQPLLNEQATSDKVKAAVRQLARQRTDEDFLLLYFSGHGQPMTVEAEEDDIYLVTSNFKELDVEEDMYAHLSLRWLREKLYIPTQAGRLLVILDCCYAGNTGRTAPDPYLEDLRRRINYYFGAPGEASGARSGGFRMALAATGHHMEASEKDGHSLMTGLLLPALRGEVNEVIEDHGEISIQGLHRYLERKMPPEQKPSLSGDSAGRDCILASYPERAAELHAKRTRRIVNERPRTYIPFYQDLLFQERPGEFERLESLLFGTENKQHSVRLGLVAVTGMGGVGKTKLAVELAYRYQERFPSGIFWMTATGKDLLDWQYQFAELALNTAYLPPDDDPTSSENQRQRALHFCRYLADHSDALLVIDNVENPDLVVSVLPKLVGKEPACTILYTSRSQSVPYGVIPYSVEQLPETVALRLLLFATRPTLLSQIEAGSIDGEAQAARAICRYAGYLPLALVHLQGLLERDQHMSLVRLAGVLEQRGTFDIIKNLFETFRLSWECVDNEQARYLFKLACYFPEAVPIPLWLLGLATGLGESRDIVDPLGEAYTQLRNVSLLEELSGDLVRLHALVREFGQRLVATDGEKGKVFLEEAGERLTTELTSLNKLEHRALRLGFWECLEEVRAALTYTKLLKTNQVENLERIERWLDRESYRLGWEQWWPKVLPGLFYQQLFNRSTEEGYLLIANTTTHQWLRLMTPVEAESRALLRMLMGHVGSVRSVAFSPDGTKVLTGSADGTARLWKEVSGTVLTTLIGHLRHVISVAFSPDGTKVLTGSVDETARIWEAISGTVLTTLKGHKGPVNSVAFSPDGTRALTGSDDGTARLWEIASGKIMITLIGRKGPVNSVAFSPDGTKVLTGSADGTARLWEATSGTVLTTLKGHKGPVNSVAFSPDGTRMLTGSADKTARLWEVASGKVLVILIGHVDSVTSVTFSPDSLKVLTGSLDQTAQIWEATSGTVLTTLIGHTLGVTGVAFSPDGTRVLTGSADETARIWEATSETVITVWEGFQDPISSATFSPDGTRMLTGSADGTARLWEVASGKVLTTLIGHKGSVNSVTFSPDGTRMLTGSADRTAKLWEAASGKVLATLIGNKGSVNSVAFSLDGTRVLTGSARGTVQIWDAENRLIHTTLMGPATRVRSIVFSPDGTRVLTGSNDGTVRLWEIASGKVVKTFKGQKGPVSSVAFSPDGTKVLTGSLNQNARLWEVASGKMLVNLKGHKGPVMSVAFSSDGTRMFTGSTKAIRCWDVASGKALAILEGYTRVATGVTLSPNGATMLTDSSNPKVQFREVASRSKNAPTKGYRETVNSISFSPDGATMLTGSTKAVRLWEVTSGTVLSTFKGHERPVSSVAFSPDGTRVLTGSDDGTAKFWEVMSGTVLSTFKGHERPVNSVAFSPDGTKVLTGSDDRTAKLWEVTSGTVLSTLIGHEGPVTSVAFSPDGTRALTGSVDKTARLWEVTNGKILANLEAHAGVVRNVTFSPDARFVLTFNTHGRVFLWKLCEAGANQLLGFYPATNEVGAAYWHNNIFLILADKGGPRIGPHIYQLKFEGNW